jgi:hypothetical protein
VEAEAMPQVPLSFSDNEDVNIIAVEAAGLVDSGEKRNISAKVGLFTEAKLC